MKRLGWVLFGTLAAAGLARADALEAGPRTVQPPWAPAHLGDTPRPVPVTGLDGGLAAGAPAGLLRPWIWHERKLTASDGTGSQFLGSAVAVTGDTALVGAALATANGVAFAGAVYVFVESDGVWTQRQKLTADVPVSGEMFGTALAVHGDQLIVGASCSVYGGGRPAPEAADRPEASAGAAYVFTRTTEGVWVQTARLGAEEGTPSDKFGQAVAIFDDTAVVGAFEATLHGDRPNQGAAYLFARSDAGWQPVRRLAAADGKAGDQFGWSVALHGDRLLIGAKNATGARPAMNQGLVYVYARNDGDWTQVQRLAAYDGGFGDQFGTSLAFDGSTALIGAMNGGDHGGAANGAVYVYERSAGGLSFAQKLLAQNGDLMDAFGISTAISGSTALVGAYYAPIDGVPQQGAAFVFRKLDGAWTRTKRLVASDGDWQDRIGFKVALDGRRAVVGAQLVDAAYLHTAHEAARADVAPAVLRLNAMSGGTAAGTLRIANGGDETLDYAIGESAATAAAVPLAPVPAPGPAAPAGAAPSAVGHGGKAGSRMPAPWTGPSGDGSLAFVLDDGSYENTFNLSRGYEEAAAIYLNRFAAPPGTGAFTIDTVSIQWPQNADGSLVGRQVNLLAYYDADRDGDPINAVRLGGDQFVTIGALDQFVDYPASFRVPGEGDVYVGFESSYARGGGWPRLFPAAVDTDAPVRAASWVGGAGNGDPDLDHLARNIIIGHLETFGSPGNWHIRATGGEADNDCIAASEIPWLTLAATTGAIAAGAAENLAVTADATALAPGSYRALLCMATNDPQARMVRVPVDLTVHPDGTLFRDGFDSP
ncbi:FG-GAP repeat protein [Dokdonella koreensis]|uniref:Quinoprotein (ISS) n=1 Tax=Dokdonella koreensis DS-123 TaxID=1300342 RepID=A0A167H5L8_9GAMM|nr:FG-GAP repeat protein [Dokdonella koreensis]ANB19032.1 Quinoprotein (ISS) [Dokdonella koreensis DS-123]